MISRQDIVAAHDRDQAATVTLLARMWLQNHPRDVAIRARYVDMLYQMTRYEDAVEVLTDAIKRAESVAERYLLQLKMGALERYRGRFHDSAKAYEIAVELDPHDAMGYVFLGGVLARIGNLTAAEATHRLGTECQKGPIDESFHNLGLVLRAQSRFREAAECFQAAIAIDPDYEDAIEALDDVRMALSLVEQGE